MKMLKVFSCESRTASVDGQALSRGSQLCWWCRRKASVAEHDAVAGVLIGYAVPLTRDVAAARIPHASAAASLHR